LLISITLFFIGLLGIVFNRRSILLILLCIEVMLLAVNLNFIFYSVYLDDLIGQLFALYVLTVAAAESAIGLALLVIYYRVHNTLSIESVNLLQGLFYTMYFFIFQEFFCLLPEIFLGLFTCLLLVLYSFLSGVLFRFFNKTFVLRETSYWLSLQLIFFTLLLLLNNPISESSLFFGLLFYSYGVYVVKIFLISFIFFIFSIGYPYFESQLLNSFEFFILLIFSVLGLLLLVQANDTLSFYLALEFQSLCFYALASFKRDSSFSVEAGLKYFILGAFSSGVFLFGCSLLYGTTGSTNFGVYSILFALEFNDQVPAIAVLGFLFVLVGFLFKITAAPFHFWAPDTYEGAPSFVSFFFAVVPKIAFVFVIIRLVFSCFYSWMFVWGLFFLSSALLSLLFGSFGALSQRKVKRFLVFSSIAHVGYLLLGISSGSLYGLSSVFFYLFVYTVMVFNMWSIFFVFQKRTKNKMFGVAFLEDFRLLYRENIFLAVFSLAFLFSIAGIPPLAGFYSKLFIFFSISLSGSFYFFLVLVICLSIVTTFYYLRWIKIVAFDFKKDNALCTSKLITASFISKAQSFLISFGLFFITFFFCSPGFLLIITHRLALLSFSLLFLKSAGFF
jgi:NADH-quinone oxidoreductase subunit N